MVENSTAQAVRYKHTPEPSSKMDTQAHLLILQLKTRSDFMSWPVIAEGFFFFFFFLGGWGWWGREGVPSNWDNLLDQSSTYSHYKMSKLLHVPMTSWSRSSSYLPAAFMMTSSNGNIFRVTSPLCREFTGEFPAQRPMTRSFDVFCA